MNTSSLLLSDQGQVSFGYYQHPVLVGDRVFFVAEGDLWQADMGASGMGKAQRLTSCQGAITSLAIPHQGDVAFYAGTNEGNTELYQLCLSSGGTQRLTYLGAQLEIVGCTEAGDVIVRSNHKTAFACLFHLYTFDRASQTLRLIDVGPANFISTAGDDTVLGRHGYGYVTWKRYRGGTAGEIWVQKGSSPWRRLFPDLRSNVLRPTCVGGRLYFMSDHEGIGALYSSTLDGQDLKRHTHFDDFYVRHLSTDGTRLVYSKGADLWLFDPSTQKNTCISPPFASAGMGRTRAFVSAQKDLSAYGLSPSGQKLCLTSRGRLFCGSPFGGPMIQLGQRHGVRYRLGVFVDEDHVIAVRDEGAREVLEIFDVGTLKARVLQGDWGRLLSLTPSPQGRFVVVANHTHALLKVDLKTGKVHTIDQSAFGVYAGVSVSFDDTFIAYGFARSHKIHVIKIFSAKTGKTVEATHPVLGDVHPVFDPKGRYLYFLSCQTYRPDEVVYQPCLITLSSALTSPLILPEESLEEGKETKESDKKKKTPSVVIDVNNIQSRTLALPMEASHFVGAAATSEKVLFFKDKAPHKADKKSEGLSIVTFDMAQLKEEVLYEGVLYADLARMGEWYVLCDTQGRLRVLRVSEKPDDDDTSFRAGGWFDFDRTLFEVIPHEEWRFMFTEAWRLQKDLFWSEDMAGTDWQGIYHRYVSLIDRVHTPAELMDLISEMQGELGVSHAYTWGYDAGHGPSHRQGLLGGDLHYDHTHDVWRFVVLGDGSGAEEESRAPLKAPGLNLAAGDALLAIDGQCLSKDVSPDHLLVGKADAWVALCVRPKGKKTPRTVWVKPVADSHVLAYRAFVEEKRAFVHKASKGKVGYLHIPDMSEWGLQEFYKAYAHEFDREALILDVRFNRGGMVSSDILSQLMHKRLGYDQSRHEGRVPYMLDAPRGPMVALCNEYTASDGDMFAHSFKLLGLGPLIGKRTWGGVIGIFPKHPLLDGSWTSQPEYAFWFHDIGWRLENKGAEPDIVVDTPPASHGQDPQLERGIAEAMKRIKKHEQNDGCQ
ncbi:peptidase [bacterium NHP-B]|nr:peptidase [bacterium NHP-B]